jgi:DNA-cytosine methyltransferase
MNVLSLFDGMSCGRIALERLGIDVDNYYASEIDKYAMKVSEANYPDIIQVGDITELDLSTLPKIDLIMGGSPCQGFSVAGKGLAFDDPRSALFFEFVRCVKDLKPKYFLLENVRMKKEYLDVISEYMGVEPIMINSALVSAQNRVRYYWTNIPGIKQPEQRGIVLRDILETQTDEKPVKDTERNQRHYRNDDEKSLCMTATMYKGAGNNGMTLVQETHDKPNKIHDIPRDILKDNERQRRVYAEEGKSPSLLARSDSPKIMIPCSNKAVGKLPEKSQTIKAQYYKSSKANFERKGTFHATGVQSKDLTWRKLTPVECERLQTVPDNYTNHVSNTQRYKMLGNGWTIEVITHILKNMDLSKGK